MKRLLLPIYNVGDKVFIIHNGCIVQTEVLSTWTSIEENKTKYYLNVIDWGFEEEDLYSTFREAEDKVKRGEALMTPKGIRYQKIKE